MRLFLRDHIFLAALLLLALLPVTTPRAETAADTKTITVFAAASLKNALDEAAGAFDKANGTKTVVSYAASSALAKQIEQGAPADVFISADLDWMNYLAKANLIDTSTTANLLGNSLVLVAPAASTADLKIEKDFGLAAALGDGKLAIGDVKAVPAGKYAKAALESLGVWAAVEPKTAQTENVRAALALVAKGEAAFGIVYQTDAAAEPGVKIVGTFPDDSHPPIIYPIAVTAKSKSPELANSLVSFLKSADGMAAFKKAGFKPLQ